MEPQKRNIAELQNWEENPKTIDGKGMERLIEQIRTLGQYKPILALPDGTVIGGNSRLRAYRQILHEAKLEGNTAEIEKYSSLWVSTIDFVQDGDLWYAVVNGVRQGKGFVHKETGMLEYALSDHDEPGEYNAHTLANMVDQYEADTSLYGVHFGTPIVIDDITPGMNQQGDGSNSGGGGDSKIGTCPECNAERPLKDFLK